MRVMALTCGCSCRPSCSHIPWIKLQRWWRCLTETNPSPRPPVVRKSPRIPALLPFSSSPRGTFPSLIKKKSHYIFKQVINVMMFLCTCYEQRDLGTFWSHSSMCGTISWAAKSKATFWNSFCSSVRPIEAVNKHKVDLNPSSFKVD